MQGAQLTMDALCGSSGIGFASHEPLPADVVRKNGQWTGVSRPVQPEPFD